ncbi:tyrosyl-DNA phosphodiesterase 2 isoform X2 [Patella vulgata]|nr:tyrosyl-DNA phosphodiesterase 2 isoform X2 [Patella vulgata]XP_050401718.1 tyrosyl-DNA phosphodiesterase 2 isoform X2 [Patella vulgata]
MSDSEEDGNLPPQQECLERCKQFAELTGTDRALAMFYLQDREWDLQRSVNDYFESMGKAGGSDDDVQVVSPPATTTVNDTEPHRLRVLSWNIDGLDKLNLESRTKAVYEKIKAENPHVVFLQEVVPPSEAMIRANCSDYRFISGYVHGSFQYYSAILLKKDFLTKFDSSDIIQFPGSIMGRNLLIAKATIKGIKFSFMTAHLESCKEHSKERMEQLRSAFKKVKEFEKDRTVIFGGDLNIRDTEIAKMNGIPENIFDLWEVTGKRPEAKFTWDMNRNDNNEFGGQFKPKCRFDRLYIKHSIPRTVNPVYFELVGLERLKNCQRFASDHWGLLTHYDKV